MYFNSRKENLDTAYHLLTPYLHIKYVNRLKCNVLDGNAVVETSFEALDLYTATFIYIIRYVSVAEAGFGLRV